MVMKMVMGMGMAMEIAIFDKLTLTKDNTEHCI